MYTLLIPKKNIFKEKRDGRGSAFWATFWKKKVAENPELYRTQFNIRTEKLKREQKKIIEDFKDKSKRYYVEVSLDEQSKSKSSKPENLWIEAGLKVVEEKPDGVITLSGQAENFEKLQEIINTATFEKASVEKPKKQENLSRQVYSVSSVSSKNRGLKNRISKEVNQFLIGSQNTKKEFILSLYSDLPHTDYEKYFSLLSERVNKAEFTKVDDDAFIHNMYFMAKLDKTELEEILGKEEFNFIRYVKLAPSLNVQRSVPSNSPQAYTVGPVLTDEKVVLIDSGVETTIIDSRLIDISENQLPTGVTEDKNHGTGVASRILFGNKFFQFGNKNLVLTPAVKIIDIKVIGDKKIKLNNLLVVIKRVVRKYRDKATIFNLSINNDSELDQNEVEELTEFIDYVSNQNDVLFVCSTGNQNGNFALGYKKIFDLSETMISSPADAINALSIGSISEFTDSDSLCVTPNFPSPFTRKGGYKSDIKNHIHISRNLEQIKEYLINNYGNNKRRRNKLYRIV